MYPSMRSQIYLTAPRDGNTLSPKRLYKDNEIFKSFLKDLGTLAPVTWLNEDYYSRMKVFEQSMKVQTVASSKGLQYRVVFVMWADLFEPHTPGGSGSAAAVSVRCHDPGVGCADCDVFEGE